VTRSRRLTPGGLSGLVQQPDAGGTRRRRLDEALHAAKVPLQAPLPGNRGTVTGLGLLARVRVAYGDRFGRAEHGRLAYLVRLGTVSPVGVPSGPGVPPPQRTSTLPSAPGGADCREQGGGRPLCPPIEGLTRGLAVELAPVRVNAVRPGAIRTPLWDQVPEERRAALFAALAERTLTKTVGEPDQIAAAHLYLMDNRFVTGTVLTVDGGAVLA
jgi:Enoyl-(Acyl carrier protein) reductase